MQNVQAACAQDVNHQDIELFLLLPLLPPGWRSAHTRDAADYGVLYAESSNSLRQGHQSLT
jgi:hypothetical protein